MQGGSAKAVETARRNAETATIARQTAAQGLLNAAKGHEAKQAAAGAAARRAAAVSLAMETAAAGASVTAHGVLARAKGIAARAAARLNATLMANPYALVAAAVAGLAYGLYRLATHQGEAERAQRRLAAAMREGEAGAAAEQVKVDQLFGTLEGATEGTREYEAARAAILSQYGDYLRGLGDEETALRDVAAAYEAVSEGVRRAAMARAKESYLAKEQEQFEKRYTQSMEALGKTLTGKYGEREGARVLAALRGVVDGRVELRELEADILAKVRAFDREHMKANAYAGGENQTYRTNVIEERMRDAIAAYAALRKAHADAETMFGEDEAAARRGGKPAGREGAELSRPRVKNRAYWEEIKRDAEAELAALDSREKSTARWLELEQTIATAREEIEKYAAGRGDGAGGGQPGAEARADRLARLDEAARRAAYEAGFAVRQAEIDGMADGFEKEIAAAALQRDRLAEENRKRAEEMVAAQRERLELAGDTAGAAAAGVETLPAAQRAMLGEYARIAEEEYQRATRAALARAMEGVLTYQQKRLEVEEAYAQRRAALYEADGQTLRAGVTEGNLAELQRAQEEALAAVDTQFAEREETYVAWMGTLSRYTLEGLRAALAEAEAALAEVEKKRPDDRQLATARARAARLRREVARAEAQATEAGRGAEDAAARWADLGETLTAAQRGFAELGEAVGGTTGEMLKGVGEIAGLTRGVIGNIQTLVQSSASAMAASSGAAASAMSVVEKGSVILSIISAVVQIGMKIASLFDRTKDLDSEIAARQAELDALQWELDNRGAADFWKQERAGVQALLLDVRRAMAEVDFGKWLSARTGNKRYAREAAAHYEAAYSATIARLTDRFAAMGYSATRALGTDVFKGAREDLDNMSRQMVAMQQQQDAEAQKKDKNRDNAYIRELEQKQAELAARMAEHISKKVDEIMGGDAVDLAGQLGDAFVDAFAAGEDAAEAWGKKVDAIVANVLKNMLIKEYLEKPMGALFDKYKRQWFGARGDFNRDAFFSSLGSMQQEMRGLQGGFAAFREAMEMNVDFFRGGELAGAAAGAAAKGIATASQDTVDELNGRMTAVQGHTYALMEGGRVLQGTCAGILESVRGIEAAAERMDRRLAGVEADVAKLRRGGELLGAEGVKIKR